MSDELWVINCYFNPSGSARRLECFHRSCRALLDSGVKLLTVQAAFGDEPFLDLRSHPAIAVRAPDVLWLKERLLNIGLEHLPDDCTKVAWVDADLIFEDPQWHVEVAQLLSSVEVVQPFTTLRYLPPSMTHFEGVAVEERRSLFSVLEERGPGYFDALAQGKVAYAVPGGAMAARREMLGAGLFDRHILGTNDAIFAYAVAGALHHLNLPTPSLAAEAAAWEQRLNSFRKDFSFTAMKTALTHLWHGARRNRRYVSRERLLRTFQFDPAAHLELTPEGCYRFSASAGELRTRVRHHLRSVREDEPEPIMSQGVSSLSTAALPADVLSALYQRITALEEQLDYREERIYLLEQRLGPPPHAATVSLIAPTECPLVRLSILVAPERDLQSFAAALATNERYLDGAKELLAAPLDDDHAAELRALLGAHPEIRWRLSASSTHPGERIRSLLTAAESDLCLFHNADLRYCGDIPGRVLSRARVAAGEEWGPYLLLGALSEAMSPTDRAPSSPDRGGIAFMRDEAAPALRDPRIDAATTIAELLPLLETLMPKEGLRTVECPELLFEGPSPDTPQT